MGYFDSQTLIHHAAFVITDSGGVTKEAYFHKVQGILLDTQTEWVETVREGWNMQCGPNKDRIVEALANLGHPQTHSNCLGDGFASRHLTDILVKAL
jgi:UDP-N-acetylglucosamine 2-epimerase